MANFANELEYIVKTASTLGNLPIEALHRIIFCSFIKAGLSIYGSQEEQEMEVENLIKTIATPYRGLVNGKLYLSALRFVKTFNTFLKNSKRAIILKEANLQHIIQFLENKVGKVDTVLVLDCASIPEIITIASKFSASRRNVTIYEEVFINPVGITRFLTEQLKSFNREDYLIQYAELLKERLNARFFTKISTVDLVTHQYGYTVDNFLKSMGMQKLFDRINHFAKQNSVLITSDHGYDVVADEHGLYITHGYKGRSPLNLSRVALFLVVD
ncbi:MAG: hypothetical protein QW175_01980 [Candidatus Bathyarchaeia archaeon]